MTYMNCKTFRFTHCVTDKLVNFDDDVFSAPSIQTMVRMDAVVADSGQHSLFYLFSTLLCRYTNLQHRKTAVCLLFTNRHAKGIH